MELTLNLQMQDHILFPTAAYVGVHIKINYLGHILRFHDLFALLPRL